MTVKTIALLAVVLLGAATTANANTIRLDATSLNPDDDPSDFFVLFDDTGDGLLQLEEVTVFSGIFFFGRFWDILDGVPDIDGMSTSGGSCLTGNPDPAGWCFERTEDASAESRAGVLGFTYALTPASVPEPGSLALLGLGLLGLGLTRRKAN